MFSFFAGTLFRARSLPLLAAGIIVLGSCDESPTEPTSSSPGVVSVSVTALQHTVSPGQTVQLTAQVLDEDGLVLPGEPVKWSSSSPSVATVDPAGLVTGLSDGATTITATSHGRRGGTDIQVRETAICDCAVVVDSTALQLIEVDSVGGTYTFRVLRGPLQDIDTTSILVGAQGGGFLRHVEAVSLSGDLLTVETSQAGLSDVVMAGGFSTSTRINDDGTQSPAGPGGGVVWGPAELVELAPGVSMGAARGSFSLDGVKLTLPSDLTQAEISVTIDQGEVIFGPTLDLGLDISPLGVQEFHAIFGGGLTLDISRYTVEAQFATDFGLKQEKTIAKLKKRFLTFVGYVPVQGAVIFELKAVLEPKIEADVQFTGDFLAGFNVTGGARYQNGSWRGVSGSDSDFDASLGLQLQGAASIKLSIVPELFIEFYESAGPFVNFDPYLEGKAALVIPGYDWSVAAALGLNLNVGFRISILEKIKKGLKKTSGGAAGNKLCSSKSPCDFTLTIPLIDPWKLAEIYGDGAIDVTNATTGSDLPPDYGLQLRPAFEIDDAVFGRKHAPTSIVDARLPRDGSFHLDNVRAGAGYPHVVSLPEDGVQGNCTVENVRHNSRTPIGDTIATNKLQDSDTVVVASDLRVALEVGAAENQMSFLVDCIPFGNIGVAVQTSGPDPDPDGYTLSFTRVDTIGTAPKWFAASPGPAIAAAPPAGTDITLGTTDTAFVLDSLIPKNPKNGASGLHTASLSGVRRNCAPQRPLTHQLTAPSGDTVSSVFSVACIPLGHLRISTTTIDPDPPPVSDTIHYQPSVTPASPEDTVHGDPADLLADDTAVISGLIPLYGASGATGGYSVRLSSVPNRCVEAMGGSRSVTVLSGDTAISDFRFTCVERVHLRTVTSGPGTDANGYGVIIMNDDGSADTVAVPVDGTIGASGIAPGDHLMRLDDVEPSCVTPATVTVAVSGVDSVLVTFNVSCPAPPPPPNLVATPTGTSTVDLTWSPAGPDSIVASYRVYRDGAFVGSTSATSFTDTGLSANTVYVYSVSTVNHAGLEGQRSQGQIARTADDPLQTGTIQFVTQVGGDPATSGFTALIEGPGQRLTSAVGSNASVLFQGLAPGDYHAILQDAPGHCVVSPDTHQPAPVTQGAVTVITFVLACGS